MRSNLATRAGRRPRRLAGLLAVGAVSLASVASCSAPGKGALMLAISTDMQTPKDVDVVSVFIETGGVVKFDYLGRVLPDGKMTLPSTIALVQPDDPNAQVHIRVIAFQNGTARVLRDVLTTVPSQVTALLRMPLDFLDEGSGQGTLPAKYVPEGVDGAQEGVTGFDANLIASSCDPMNYCANGGGVCSTMINGVCQPATVPSSTLPAFQPAAVFGDGGGVLPSGALATCFDVQTCFAAATPVTTLDAQHCSFPLPGGTSPSMLNVAVATQSTGACLPTGECYVPLPSDPDEGWVVQGATVQLAPGLCTKLGTSLTLAMTSACAAQTLSEPVCEPTTPAEVEAGLPPPADASSRSCDGSYVVTCASNAACGGGSGGMVALTVSGSQATLFIPMDHGGGDQLTPVNGTADPTTCQVNFTIPGSDSGSCDEAFAVSADLLTGVISGVQCSSSASDGSCVHGTMSCTVARGTLDGGSSTGDDAGSPEPDASVEGNEASPPFMPESGVGPMDATVAPTPDAGPPPEDSGSTTCPATWTTCNGVCVNEQTDPSNCSSCGMQCAAGMGCSGGTCVEQESDAETVEASESCTSNSECPAYAPVCVVTLGTCVQCLADTDCPAGQTCQGQVCTTVTSVGVDAATGCTPGSSQCAGVGVQTCTASGQWGAQQTCATGICQVGACTGSTAMAQSCLAGGSGLTNCGTSADESCCTSLEVPGGSYYRTYDPIGPDGGPEVADGGGPDDEADLATVSGFRLDKYSVTVGRFRQFVNAVLPSDGGAGWLPPAGSGIHTHLNGGLGLVSAGDLAPDGGVVYEPGWVTSDNINVAPTNSNLACQEPYATWTNSPSTQENLPINCVTWQEAYAFCIWDGGFLPSEAEWEYAAAGGAQQREYPWGSTPPGINNQYAIYGSNDCNYPTPGGECTGVANIAPVGTATLGAGLWGQLDMAGNVVQWNLDWYATSYADPCTDCAYLSGGSDRVLRGGSFFGTYSPPSYMLAATRSDTTPTFLSNGVGFRCARTP